jgi:uncharacterized protein YcnI
VVSATIGAAALTTTGIASAHVTANVYGEQPEQGGYTAVTLRVPSEKDQVSTTKVTLTVPADYDVASVRTKPVPGWTSTITKNGSGTRIAWTAEHGKGIPPTGYQEFGFTAGPLPKDVDTMVLPAVQTYSDGSVVRWDEPPKQGAEPEHPAPTVPLAAPSGSGHHDTAAPATSADAQAAAETSDNTARWLGGAGLVVGALGLGVGAGAALRARKGAAK